MIPKIKDVKVEEKYILKITFDDGKTVLYDVYDDIVNISYYKPLAEVDGLFESVKLDESRTIVFWTEDIDLPSDMLYEYGKII